MPTIITMATKHWLGIAISATVLFASCPTISFSTRWGSQWHCQNSHLWSISNDRWYTWQHFPTNCATVFLPSRYPFMPVDDNGRYTICIYIYTPPLIIDTGALFCITPLKTDFQTLCPSKMKIMTCCHPTQLQVKEFWAGMLSTLTEIMLHSPCISQPPRCIFSAPKSCLHAMVVMRIKHQTSFNCALTLVNVLMHLTVLVHIFPLFVWPQTTLSLHFGQWHLTTIKEKSLPTQLFCKKPTPIWLPPRKKHFYGTTSSPTHQCAGFTS